MKERLVNGVDRWKNLEFITIVILSHETSTLNYILI